MGTSSIGNSDDKIIAPFAYLLFFISALLVIVLEESSRYCLFHAWQSLFCFLFYIVFAIIFALLDDFAWHHVVLSWIWLTFYLIVWILLMVMAYKKADSGELFVLPVLGKWSENQASKKFPVSSGPVPTDSSTPTSA